MRKSKFSKEEYNERMTALLRKTPYPSDSKMKKIAREMGKTHTQIYRWFCNHRFNHGIKRKTIEHEKLLKTFAKNSTPSKMRKSKFSKEEYNERMTALLRQTPYPSDSKMKKIAREMGKTHSQIYRWFCNHRFNHGINRKTIEHEKLLKTFAKNSTPSKELCKQLAKELGRSEQYISYWFWKARRKNMNKNQGQLLREVKIEKEEKLEAQEKESVSDIRETITTTVQKMVIPEDFLFPVLDGAGKHLFSVTQREINENKELYM